MAYTLRGRLESRLAAVLGPLVAACFVALALEAWWPVELASLMLVVGLTFDLTIYHRLFPYQPGWAALPLGVLELAVVMGLARLLHVGASLSAALAFYAGAWLLAQLMGHAVFPLARLSYGEDGGELGRAGAFLVATALVVLAAAAGVAWMTQPPVVHLAAGIHEGPLVLDHSQRLVGEPGAIVRGGIVVTADDVTIQDVTVLGGENGIEVEHAERVLLERVHVIDSRAGRDQRPSESGDDPRLLGLVAREPVRPGDRHLVRGRSGAERHRGLPAHRRPGGDLRGLRSRDAEGKPGPGHDAPGHHGHGDGDGDRRRQ